MLGARIKVRTLNREGSSFCEPEKEASTNASGNEDFVILRLMFPSCMILRLRGCGLQVHPEIEPQKHRDRRVGVPNLNRGAPS